jgi:hypothetical protein
VKGNSSLQLTLSKHSRTGHAKVGPVSTVYVLVKILSSSGEIELKLRFRRRKPEPEPQPQPADNVTDEAKVYRVAREPTVDEVITGKWENATSCIQTAKAFDLEARRKIVYIV